VAVVQAVGLTGPTTVLVLVLVVIARILLGKILVAGFPPNRHCSYHLGHILLLWVLAVRLLALRRGQAETIPFYLT
jgi:hypothetical protein